MRKLNLIEGETQRILSLHKSAVLKESRNLINEESYKLTLIKRDGYNSGVLKKNLNTSSFKVTQSNKYYVEGEVKVKEGGGSNFRFDCKRPQIMTLTTDQVNGSEYEVNDKLTSVIKWYCAGKPSKNNAGGGKGTSDNNTPNSTKYTLGSEHKLYASNNKAVLKVLKQSTMNFYPEKNGATLKATFLSDNKTDLNVWYNCGTGKFSAKNILPVIDPTTNQTIPAGQKTFTYYTDKPFREFLQKKCEILKKGSKTETSPDGTDSESSDGTVYTGGGGGGNGQTYPFDYQTVANAIQQKFPDDDVVNPFGQGNEAETQLVNVTADMYSGL